MDIRNYSSRSTAELLPLIDFVASVTIDLPALILQIQDPEKKGLSGGGLAVKKPDRYGRPSFVVTIILADGLRYPYLNRHQGLNTLTRLNSWEEEFVFILSHELRHVEQFIAGVYSVDRVKEMEEDADNVGRWALEQYREPETLLQAA